MLTHVQYAYDDLTRVTRVRDFLTGDGGASNWKAFDVNYTLDDLDRRPKTFFEFTDTVNGTVQASQYDSSNWDKNSRITQVQQPSERPLAARTTTRNWSHQISN